MKANKKRSKRPRWRKPRTLRRVGMGALALAVAALGVWVVAGAGGNRQSGKFLMEPAPPFSLPTTSGETFVAREHIGRHALLLYFSEGIGCAPCWDQIVDLEADWDRFNLLGVRLVSVMVDPLDQLRAEAKDRGIKGIVATDVDKTVSNQYDAMQASMHPGVKPGHTFVLVNKSGKMIWRWDWLGHGKPMYMDVDDLYKEVSKWLKRAG